jgi:hypothetical protein
MNDNHTPGFAEPRAPSKKRKKAKHKHNLRYRWESVKSTLVGRILRYSLAFLVIFLLIVLVLWAAENLRT